LKSFSSSSLANGSFGKSLARLAAQRSSLKTGSVAYFGYLAMGLLLIGTVLRVGQYAIGAALWHDELALARNIVEKPLGELLVTPLDYTQVAPIGFLLLEKAAITAFGNNEYALRLLPLLCALISLPLFADVACRLLASSAALLALALFCLSPTLIGFGSQVKQYSMDVAVAVAMTVLTLRWWERQGTSCTASGVFLGVGGFVAVWFSHTAVLVLVALGGALLLETLYRRERVYFARLIPIAILWSGGSVAMLTLGTHLSASTYAYMQGYWAGGFIPISMRADLLWLWRAFHGFFQNQLRYPLPAVALLLMLIGTLALVRRRRWYALVVLAPLVVSLAASAARQYPFGDRVSLFLLPFILLLLAEGIDGVRQTVLTAWRPLGVTIVILAMLVPTYSLYAFYPSYPEQPMPTVLAYIQALRQPQDAVYVYHGAWHAVGYYGTRYGLPLQTVVSGRCGDQRTILRDLEQFRGRTRVWVIISHVVGPLKQRETILGYLDTIGLRRDSIVTLDRERRPSSSAYLYDLSDTVRLRAASAETYTPPARGQGREYPCLADITT
jgi:uncharacterized membrane protein